MTPDKRNSERFHFELPVRLKSDCGENTSMITRDLSSRGAFVWTSSPLDLGATIELIVSLPAEKCFLNVKGSVIRVERDGMAIKFKRPRLVGMSGFDRQ